ncbi:DsbA family oxidoreductase [Virgibacillus sp. DJP39]|uniref:DsbA family oxidoreductase n=1 Tax=Virgibacillus sp. DJP39 TaxID=3409790 RepID=UPI003BB64381
MVKIKVYSDYVCPFCFLLEKPLLEAMEGKEAELEWMPFELRPEPNETLKPEDDYLQTTWKQSVYPFAEQLGVELKLPTVSPQPYTHLAFEGFQFAKKHNLGNEYSSRMLKAFFQEDLDIGNVDVLATLAEEIGLDKNKFHTALVNRTYKDIHLNALKQVEDENITSVPTLKIGDKTLVGLHSKERLAEAIDEANKPRLTFGDGAVCGPDGCYI